MKNQLTPEQKKQYWQANLKYVASLLSIWAFVSFGLSIFLADWLNQFQFMNFKLGFWFAQQGSIYVFCILIFVYIYLMKKLDHKYKLDI